MLIYKENLLMHRYFWSKIGDFRACEKTAPKTAQIPLAGQRVIRVQWERPDFDNGMKTLRQGPRMCTTPCGNARTLITG